MLPLCDTPFSRIREDKWPLYYYEVDKWSNIYAYQIGLGGSYRLGFKYVKITGTVCHYGWIVRGGVLGGTSSAIYCRWKMGDDYDDEIVHGMNYRHWLQIKWVKNLCNNNTETNKGQYGYNPRYKFYNKWHCLIHNVNFLTNCVKLDLCGDETSLEKKVMVRREMDYQAKFPTSLVSWILGRQSCTGTSTSSVCVHIGTGTSYMWSLLYGMYGVRFSWRESCSLWSWWWKDRRDMREKIFREHHTQRGKINSLGIR